MLTYIIALVFIYKRRFRFPCKGSRVKDFPCKGFPEAFTYCRVEGYKKQDQGITEKHFRKYIWNLSFLFKETF